jgi:hypothetical protein
MPVLSVVGLSNSLVLVPKNVAAVRCGAAWINNSDSQSGNRR